MCFSYELVARSEDFTAPGAGARLPPIKLKKLEKRRSKHRAKTPSNELAIVEKLEKAEERRKVSDRSSTTMPQQFCVLGGNENATHLPAFALHLHEKYTHSWRDIRHGCAPLDLTRVQ